MTRNRRYLMPLMLLVVGTAVVLFVLFSEWLTAQKGFYLGFNERGVFRIGGVTAAGGLMLLLLSFRQAKTGRTPGNWISVVRYAVYFGLIGYICYTVGLIAGFNTYAVGSAVNQKFAIGIYRSSKTTPLRFSGAGIKNPVLTRKHATDISAKIVADPFLVCEQDTFYIFFEIWNNFTNQGDIAVAAGSDGYTWRYRQVVLDEPFHLSYPNVFKWQGEYYMIPEATITHSVRLYKAETFPYQWVFAKTILTGPRFVDSTIFEFDNRWWLFSETGANDVLSLYYADTPMGPWTEHPQSPVIRGNANYARPGGNVVMMDGKLIRFAQDDDPGYGNQVWAFEITKLSTVDYQERRIGRRPVLRGKDAWNKNGMHQLSPIQLANGDWIAAVDGF